MVLEVESQLRTSALYELSTIKSSTPLEIHCVQMDMDIRAPMTLSVDFLKGFQDSPTGQRTLRAFSFAKKGEDLLLSDTSNESDSKEMLQFFSEAYLLDTAVFQFISVDKKKLEAVCKRVVSEAPACEDALIAQLPLYGSHPSDLEQGISILTTATEVMETSNPTEPEEKLKQSRIYVALGWLQYRKRYYESSLRSFEKSSQLSPDDYTALEGAAECCRWLERLSDSKRLHGQFLSKAPNCHKLYAGTYYRIAEINFQMEDAPGFCYYFEKGMESEGDRLPFLSEVDPIVKRKLLGFYIITKTDHLPFCSSCLQLEIDELRLQRCRQCWSVYYCNRLVFCFSAYSHAFSQ